MTKFDGVIEAVHFAPDGQVAWVRAYERRGSAFSDHVLIQRERLIEKLQRGKKFVLGRRIPLQAGSFETSVALRLVGRGKALFLSTDLVQRQSDHIEGVPVI
jgi:hypothetical protein